MPSKKQRQKRRKQVLEAAADANFGGASDESAFGDGPTELPTSKKAKTEASNQDEDNPNCKIGRAHV